MADGTQEQAALKRSPVASINYSGRRRLPVFHQAEANECGLACLAMVASYFGLNVDLAGLRLRLDFSGRGTNLARLAQNAQQLGLVARPVQLPLEALKALKTPAILHWDMNHFVVLQKAGARGVVVHDPAFGRRRMAWDEVSKHFTGIAMELNPAPAMQPLSARGKFSLRRALGEIRGLGAALTQIILLAIALEVFSLLTPFYSQWILDQVVVSNDRDLLTVLGIAFICIALIQVALTACRSWALTWLGVTLNTQWNGNVGGHLLRLPLQWFERRHVGDVLSRMNSTQIIQRTLTTQFATGVLDGLMSLLILVVMAFYSVPLTLLALGLIALYAVVRFAFYRPLREANESQLIQAARQQSELLESIRGILPVKLAKQELARAQRYANAVVRTANQDVAVQRLVIAFAAVSQGVFGIGRVVLIWLAARAVLDGELSVGILVAFSAYADQLISRASALIEKLIDLRMLSLQGERLADITDSSEEHEPAVPWQGPPLPASLSVRNLSFRYASDEPWIIRNLSFEVCEGESLAITGPSGCGKTTLVKLLCGLLQPSEGEICMGDVPIARLGSGQYRSQLSAVMQEDSLLAGSLLENITFGGTDIDLERVVHSAAAAAVHEDIMRMPMGYQSSVGDMGSTLSGGQKQRVLLARALYRKPRILILDEATSHLDSQCELAVNNAINAMRKTRIVIAHRQETIASADRVLTLASAAEEIAREQAPRQPSG